MRNKRSFLRQTTATKLVGTTIISVMMIAVALSSVFVLMPDTIVRADSTYTYTETFEDDTIGDITGTNGTNPNASWYWSYSSKDDSGAVGRLTNYYNASAGKCLESKISGSNYFVKMFKLYNGTDFVNNSIDYLQIYMLGNSTEARPSSYFWEYWPGGWGDPSGDYCIGALYWYDGDICWHNGSSYNVIFASFSADTWYKINIAFHWDNDTVACSVNDGSVTWWNFRNTASGLYAFSMGYVSSVGGVNGFFNNVTIGTDYLMGEQEEPPLTASSFSLSGLDGNDRITWSGEAGETVWSNASSYGTLTVQTNINSTDNCTAIHLDIADFVSVIDADNISVEVRNTADGTFDGTTASLGTSPNYNLTIDSSAGSWFQGTNPFPMDGAAWTNVTLEVRFKCAIPGNAGVGTYVNTSASWNVLWKLVS